MKEAVKCYNLPKGEFKFAFTCSQADTECWNEWANRGKAGQYLQGDHRLRSVGHNTYISMDQDVLHYYWIYTTHRDVR